MNSSAAITQSRDKLYSLQLLLNNGIDIPTTGFANSPLDTDDLIKMVGGTPLIVKLLEASDKSLKGLLDPHIEGNNLHLHYGDLTDSTNLIRIIQEVQPDEIYNLAAMSHVHVSFEAPEYTANADGIGTLRLFYHFY